jgi:cytochrome d ubiquinol oxidase subunit II
VMTSIVSFWVIAGMLGAYTLLDGYDLGAGAISLVLGQTRQERSAIVESIGPFWSGNEVWLVAAGGTLFALFPKAYAVSFSGFYLPFIVLLWLLMFRGIAIELREILPGDVWRDFWDTAFAVSSLLLVVVLGVALGNLVRGLQLGPDGYFIGTFSALLNPYALAVALLALLALVQHGLAYVADNVDEPLAGRARRFVLAGWWFVLVVYIAVTAVTIVYHRSAADGAPLAIAGGILALISLVTVRDAARRGAPVRLFRRSFLFVGGLVLAAAATMYPYLIRPFPAGARGMTIFEASPPPAAVAISLTIALIGLAVVIAYSIYVRARMAPTFTPR